MKRLIHALVALSLCSPLWARAEVDLTKLTYWHEWVMTRTDWGDLVQTYQGNSSYDGMFGLGWCAAMHVSDPKLRLSGFHVDLEQWLSLRGQAIVNNRCGTASQKGREIMFLPTYATKKMLRDMSVADYVKQMKDDETLEFIQVGVKAESASLKLSRTGMRIFPVGRPEMGFSTDGVLQVIAATTIVRDARGRISGLREGNTDTIRFAYGEDNHVKSFRTDQDYQGTFKYDANGRQVEHENAWKKTYLFDFDPAGRLQSVHWPDGTQVTMFYLGNTSKIASFLERDGSMETYRIIEGDTSTERRVLAARMKDGVKIHEFDAQYWFTENGDLKQARVRQRTKDSEWTALDETYSLQTN